MSEKQTNIVSIRNCLQKPTQSSPLKNANETNKKSNWEKYLTIFNHKKVTSSGTYSSDDTKSCYQKCNIHIWHSQFCVLSSPFVGEIFFLQNSLSISCGLLWHILIFPLRRYSLYVSVCQVNATHVLKTE